MAKARQQIAEEERKGKSDDPLVFYFSIRVPSLILAFSLSKMNK